MAAHLAFGATGLRVIDSRRVRARFIRRFE
jgi:hypothetical protein